LRNGEDLGAMPVAAFSAGATAIADARDNQRLWGAEA